MDSRQQQQFTQYLELLLLWSGKKNLVSRNDIRFIVERHFLPCSFLYLLIDRTRKMKIIDLGSGAGFPGVVLAILLPDHDISLIDSSKKKFLFLHELCDLTGVKAEILCERIESFIQKNTAAYDLVVSRAVDTSRNLWIWSNSLLAEPGKVIMMKGGKLETELAHLQDENIVIKQIKAEPAWISLSENLKDKIYLILEKNLVRK